MLNPRSLTVMAGAGIGVLGAAADVGLGAVARRTGGSGYSGTLSTNPATRQQQLICDPPEPAAGSTSVFYDPALVSLRELQLGPGYSLTGGGVQLNFGGETGFQPYVENPNSFGDSYSFNPAGGTETGYAQVRFSLTFRGEQGPGQITPPSAFDFTDEDGATDGIDTHAFIFDVRPGVSLQAPVYEIRAVGAGVRGNPEEDFLLINDGQPDARLGPDQLAPAIVYSPEPSAAALLLGLTGAAALRRQGRRGGGGEP